ncbi:MAG: hypothetical protein IKX67_07350 [Bacteroidales bacterium]|nr:hypothetical protein [Bacteroidales bacterium]
MPSIKDNDLLGTMAACRALGICRTTLGKYEVNGLIKSSTIATGRKVWPGHELKKLFKAVNNS